MAIQEANRIDASTATRDGGPTKGRGRQTSMMLPSRVVLNAEGEDFFMRRGAPLSRFEIADGGSRYGFYLEKLDFSWVKKILSWNFAEKLELQVVDLFDMKEEIMDLLKLVVFSMIRRRVKASALNRVYGSEMIRRWNRANPKRTIGPGMKFKDQAIRGVLSKSTAMVGHARAEILGTAVGKLRAGGPARDELSGKIEKFAEELVFDLDPIVLFVVISSVGAERKQIVTDLADIIAGACKSTDIADLAGMTGVELAGAAERSALVRELRRTRVDADIRTLLGDPSTRTKLLSTGSRGMTLVASFPRELPREGMRLRFRLTVYDDGADAAETKRLMEDFGERPSRVSGGRRLDAFLESSGGVYGDDGLCFYYLRILQEACESQGITMEAHIKESFDGGPVATHLSFGL